MFPVLEIPIQYKQTLFRPSVNNPQGDKTKNPKRELSTKILSLQG